MKYKSLIIIIACIITVILFCNNSNNKPLKHFNISSTTTKIKKQKTEAKITIVGDFLFEEPYYSALNSGEDVDRYFSLVKNYFDETDLNIGNMEVVVGNDSLSVSGTGYEFCAPESIGYKISELGLDVLSTANNHAYDRGIEGVKSTIDFFKNNTNILTVGTNESINKMDKIVNVNNIKFGFLSYASGTNKEIKEEDLYSINLYRDSKTNTITEESKNNIKKDIENIKDKVDIIIVLLHWGTEFTNTPTKEQKELALFLNTLGVNIIVGSHSHSIQPIEWIGTNEHKTLVYYSLGNFVSADDDISRTGEEFDNAYQFGLLSNVTIKKENNNIIIEDVMTEPIVNYYDNDFKNFLLVPYSKYNNELERTHYRFKYNFNKDFIYNMYKKVIKEEFRK